MQDHLDRLFDAALDAVIGMDAGGHVTAWNTQAELIFGWPRLSWGERGGPPVEPPQRRGFGSFLLDTMIDRAHGAAGWRSTTTPPGSGCCWSCRSPDSPFRNRSDMPRSRFRRVP